MDNGMDNPLPISREGLLEAIRTAMSIVQSGEKEFAVEYLNNLYWNIKSDRASIYPPVVRKRNGN